MTCLYLSQWWPLYWCIYVSWPQWVNQSFKWNRKSYRKGPRLLWSTNKPRHDLVVFFWTIDQPCKENEATVCKHIEAWSKHHHSFVGNIFGCNSLEVNICWIDKKKSNEFSAYHRIDNYLDQWWHKSLMRICITKPQCAGVNTLGPRQDGRHFPDVIFKWIFLNKNVWISVRISLKFVPRGPINNILALFLIMAWHQSGDKPLSEPMIVFWCIYVSLGLNKLRIWWTCGLWLVGLSWPICSTLNAHCLCEYIIHNAIISQMNYFQQDLPNGTAALINEWY